MAEKTFNTRLKLKYDTYENWTRNNPVLLAGEVAVTTVSVQQKGTVNKVPSVLMKIGDGTTAYNSLEFTFAKAADVYDWAKAETKPSYSASEISGIGSYIESYVQNDMGISTDTNTQYTIAKVDDYTYKLKSKEKGATEFTTEVATINIPNKTSDIEALQGLVGSTSVASQISTASSTLSGRIDGLDTAVSGLNTLVGDTSVASQISTAISSKADLVDGKVPSTQLPSYVDDVIEGYLYNGNFYQDAAHTAAKKITGEGGKIYVDLSNNKTYRYSGSAFVVISETLAVGTTTGTAYDGKAGADLKSAYDTHAANTSNPHSVTKTQVGLSNVTNDKQVKGLSSGTTADHVVTWGADGYTVKDSGFTIAKSVPSDAKFTDNNTTYTFAEGSTNGAFSVTPSGGSATSVKVHGLGSAAYTASTAYDASGAAATAESNANTYTDGKFSTLVGDTSVSSQISTAFTNANLSQYAKDSSLATIAKTGNVNDLVQTSGDVLVFNCGTSSTNI